jgi:hypothetical protein
MKLGIMQPYFFPYIGYFQLINAVDLYVNLDHVSFMKRSYMTRNVIKNGISINVPIKNASQHVPCNKTFIDISDAYVTRFTKTLENLYSKSPYYKNIIETIIEPEFTVYDKTISEFNLSIIYRICKYIGIDTEIEQSSSVFNVDGLKSQEMIKEIVIKSSATEYINAIGGQSLYQKSYFEDDGISLKFIKMENVEFENPYTSILDIMFSHDPEHINKQLNKFTLI